MAELVLECPTGDGITVEFDSTASARGEPPTNLRIREFLKKQHERRSPAGPTAVDSENSSDDQQRQMAHSPPPNCSICLGRVKSKCFTDSCMHQFCFSCLLEWSKVKPECPLCKQTFKSIIHNVTSMDSYEEYKVEAQQRHMNWINLPFQAGDVDISNISSVLFSASLPRAFPANRAQGAIEPYLGDRRNRVYHLLGHHFSQSALVQRFVQIYPDDVYPNRNNSLQWRQYIYYRRLYAEPLTDFNGGTRDITAEFYRANPAQLHRLLPWLQRELTCLADNQAPTQPITYSVQRIQTLIQTYDMTTYEFQCRVRVLVPNNTDHFIHELINFARSPYDTIGYDQNVRYLPRFESTTPDIVTLSSSEEGSDVEFVGPVVDVVTIDSGAVETVTHQQNTSGNDNESGSNSNAGNPVNSNESIEQAGASTSGVQTILATQTATQNADARKVNLSGDESDEEEVNNYLHSKKIDIRGRMGPSPKQTEKTNDRYVDDDSQRTIPYVVNDAQNSELDSQRTIVVGAAETLPAEEGSSETASTSQANAVNAEGNGNENDTSMATAAGITPKVEPNTHTKSTQDIIDADNDSDSDECQFVCAKKPPHLRTPEYVSLNSDSDSDVVFVSREISQTPRSPPILSNRLEASLDAISNDVKNSILNVLSAAQQLESSTNLRRKRGRAVDNVATTYTAQNTSTGSFEAKPSTSIQEWLIRPTEDNSRHISPRSSAKRRTPPNRPRLTTTIKISRGKRIYESPSSDDATSDANATTDPGTSSTSSSNSFDSTDVESSSHEEYVTTSRVRTKRPANNDGPSLAPRKKYRKRRCKPIYDSTTSDDSDDDDDVRS